MKERYGAGAEADSGAGAYTFFSFLFFSFLFGRGLDYHLVFSFVSGDEG